MQQIVVLSILALTLGLFMWGRWRYDIVALIALLLVTLVGAVPPAEAFLGFGHPAVITVALVLILSQALQNAGIVDLIGSLIARVGNRTVVQVGALTVFITVISGFMNNVGALAILLPVTLNLSRTTGTSPSHLLIPLAFGSLLGGMTTLIGTPPNLIVSGFREQALGQPYQLFDFLAVGVCVAFSGVIFLTLIGWWLLPERVKGGETQDVFDIQRYLTELFVPDDGAMVGKTVAEVRKMVEKEGDIVFLGLLRGGQHDPVVYSGEILQQGDGVIVEADSAVLELLTSKGFTIKTGHEHLRNMIQEKDQRLMEAVVMPGSHVLYQKLSSLRLPSRFGVSVLAVARKGKRLTDRFRDILLQPSDVLLFRGAETALREVLGIMGCLPLAKRDLRVGYRSKLAATVGIFLASLLSVAFGVLSIQVAFLAAVILMIVFQMLSVQEIYDAVDLPVVVLLGAMIPVGGALQTSGAAEWISMQVVKTGSVLPAEGILCLVLVLSMFLSDIVNNAAAAVLMCPIAANIAEGLSVAPDPFFMAVAIGASCAFLTPIGHQSSALVMGPGGYHFGDYWKVGLPLEILIVVISMPALLYFWPLHSIA